jgi:hypothetical protein
MMGITHAGGGPAVDTADPAYQTFQRLGVRNGPPRFGHLPMVMGRQPEAVQT